MKMETWQFATLIGVITGWSIIILAASRGISGNIQNARNDISEQAEAIKVLLREHLDEEYYPEWLDMQYARAIDDKERLKELDLVQRNRFPINNLQDELAKFRAETLQLLDDINSAIKK